MASPGRIRSVVADFDGTICPQDVSEEILGSFAPPEWLDIDLEFQAGTIGARECLVRQAALLDGRGQAMLEFALDRYRIDPSFRPFVEWAHRSGIEVAVASDGFGFYVEPMLRAGGLAGVPVLTNELAEDGGRRRVRFPNEHPVCVGCGTCKMKVVLDHRQRLGPVAFIGEGHTDRFGALYADLVFAKKHLVEICRRDGVPFLPWETFDDVLSALEGRESLPGALAPAVCPGWTEP